MSLKKSKVFEEKKRKIEEREKRNMRIEGEKRKKKLVSKLMMWICHLIKKKPRHQAT